MFSLASAFNNLMQQFYVRIVKCSEKSTERKTAQQCFCLTKIHGCLDTAYFAENLKMKIEN